MRRRILLTGGSGLLAVNWAVTARQHYDVILGGHNRKISLNGCSTISLDLESADHLAQSFEQTRPDLVVHTAGLTSVEQCERDPVLASHVNTQLAENVAYACARQGVALVLISTDHLFAGNRQFSVESNTFAPVNVYGHTKAAAEQNVQNIYPSSLIVRTNFFGWGTSYRKSISDWILDGLRNRKEMGLFQDVFFTPVHAENLVAAIHELVLKNVAGVVNVVGDERISKFDFGLELAAQFGLDPQLIKPIRIADQSELVRRPLDLSLSNRKLCGLIGRKIGSVSDQIELLRQQEISGISRELGNL